MHHAFQLDREDAALRAVVAAEKRVEHRIAVGPREAAPDDSCLRVDQRVESAVADHTQREVPPGRSAHAAAPLRVCRGDGESSGPMIRTSSLTRRATSVWPLR